MGWSNFSAIFCRGQSKDQVSTQKIPLVCEGVGGHHHYHLHYDGEFKAFCGESIMRTSIPLSAWGIVTAHIKERWCQKCYDIMKASEQNDSN